MRYGAQRWARGARSFALLVAFHPTAFRIVTVFSAATTKQLVNGDVTLALKRRKSCCERGVASQVAWWHERERLCAIYTVSLFQYVHGMTQLLL